jgi:hypothetical protein
MRLWGVAVVVPETVAGMAVGRAAVDNLHAAESGSPLVLDQDGLHGLSSGSNPAFQKSRNLTEKVLHITYLAVMTVKG